MSRHERLADLWMMAVYYTRIGRAAHLVRQTGTYLVRFDPAFTAMKIRNYLVRHLSPKYSYSKWLKAHAYTKEQLEAQRNHQPKVGVTFSVIVPLHNTDERHLCEMLDSVLAQTYARWELCLADGSDEAHAYVGRVCGEYAARDKRIRYRRLGQNLGISGNTNACLQMATGDYLAMLDHDDLLMPAALYRLAQEIQRTGADLVYTDEAVFLTPNAGRILSIHFKPDFALDNLRANNYLCHLTAYRRSLIDVVGPYRSAYDGSQDHDMMLRIVAHTQRIAHVPEVLYLWRAHRRSVALGLRAKPWAAKAGRDAVRGSLREAGIDAQVESTAGHETIYRLRYGITGRPKVSIVIPTCDHVHLLRRCLESIEQKTTYPNYEVVLVENNSKRPETFDYYREATQRWNNVVVAYWPGPWNWSAINNFGVERAASGDYYLLLNNDTEVISAGWLEEMLMYVQRQDVGAVGAMLYYPDMRVQHAGVIIGRGGVDLRAWHAFHNSLRGDVGYAGRLLYAQDLSAVTGACVLVRKEVWDEVGGADEQLAVCYNDIDLCLRIRKAGYLVVWTPHAELYHYESQSRGYDDTPSKSDRSQRERDIFIARWADEYASGDPYYNPNLSLEHTDFRVASPAELAKRVAP